MIVDMDKYDIYIQLFGVIWVVGGSLFAIKKADWLVRWNARFGIKTNAKLARIVFTFTLILGILGAINLAAQVISRSRS